MNEMCLVCKGMLDPIIISLLLTIYLCVTYLEYNNYLWILLTINLTLGVSNFYKQTFLSFLKQDSKIWREICLCLSSFSLSFVTISLLFLSFLEFPKSNIFQVQKRAQLQIGSLRTQKLSIPWPCFKNIFELKFVGLGFKCV